MKSFLSIINVLLVLSIIGNAQDLILDETFGNKGQFLYPLAQVGTGNPLKFDSQENIYIGTSYKEGYGVIKVNEKGQIDNYFGKNGQVIFDFPDYEIYGRMIDIQLNNQLLISGYIRDNEGKVFGALMRFNSNGELDTNFANGGRLILAINDVQLELRSLLTLSNGKIIVAGNAVKPNQEIDFFIFCILLDGTFDKTFGENGRVYIEIEGLSRRVNFIKTDGENILLGGFIKPLMTERDYFLLKLLPNGQLDSNFGNKGIVFSDFNQQDDYYSDIVIQEDGKLILIGSTLGQAKHDFAIAKYNKDGTLDRSFGKEGQAIIDFSKYEALALKTHDIPLEVFSTEDNGLLILGTSFQVNPTSSDKKSILIKLKEDGSLDENFGKDGMIEIPVDRYIQLTTMLQQADGRFVIGGSFWPNGDPTEAYLLLTRYLLDLNVGTITLSQNPQETFVYPNPIQETATLKYVLEKPENLTIQLMDINGRLLKTYLQNELQQAGSYQQQIDLPIYLSTGVYFLKMTSASGQLSIKVTKSN